jgi:uncharacterized protein YuzE
VKIERFVWTEHAEMRLHERRLDAAEIEQAIKNRHSAREVNDGRAEWLVSGDTADGTAFEAIYTIRTKTTGQRSGSSLFGGWILRLPVPVGATLARAMFAYYDSDADIAWFPTGESDDVVSERVPGGLRDYDRTSHKLVAIEVWDASTRLPASILEALPAPSAAHGAAA